MAKRVLWIIGFLFLALAISGIFFSRAIAPANANGKKQYFRVNSGETLAQALNRAEEQGLLKSARITSIYSSIRRDRSQMASGTYELSSAMSGGEIIDVLLSGKPIHQMVLIREGLWIKRIAQVINENSIATENEFIGATKNSELSKEVLGYSHPTDSLEGYLFPDTYDLPPLIGAKKTVEKMLTAFKTKVYEPLGKPTPEKMHKWIIIASMIELEAAIDTDRPKIAAVIYNRLAKKMPLQIDATINYAKQEWRPLARVEYQFDHPYNTYKNYGLPPGPICSPGLASIKAAANPIKSTDLYYVALPSRKHLFARTFEQHKKNIAISRKAFAGIKK